MNENTQTDWTCRKHSVHFEDGWDVIDAAGNIVCNVIQQYARQIVASHNATLAKHVDAIEALRGTLENIQHNANCQIPFYAYGDNEAACDMAGRLKAVVGLCETALALQPAAQEQKEGA